MMRFLRLMACAAILGFSPAQASDADARAEERADLLEALRAAPNEAVGRAAADALWKLWFVAPDDEAQKMLDAALERRRLYDFVGAIKHLDELVIYAPDYAEGWNQRATVLFLQEKYDRSLEDIARTLALEPAHFGSMAGKAVILMRQGRMLLGQQALRQAVAIHPYLSERAMLIEIPDDQ